MWKHLPFVVPVSLVKKKLQRIRSLIIISLICAGALYPLQIQIAGLEIPQVNTQGAPLLIALDVSLSMSATDITPSRMEAAKKLIDELLVTLPQGPVGVMVFAWVPVEIIPLTTHRDALRQRVASLAVGDFPLTQTFLGTAMGDALLLAHRRLMQWSLPGHILLISDGDPSKWVDTLQVADILARDGIRIFTLIMWTGNVLLWYDTQGWEVYAQTSLTTMQTLATRTQGQSRVWETGEQQASLWREIWQQLRSVSVLTRSSFPLNEFLRWWIIGCSILLLIEKSIALWCLRRYVK